MRLNRLEISGFKSFARSTVLEFPEHLTAVVGPNGSGKSNIVDAFRWVLGEQSPSVLRCTRMDDLIFSGTANRRRLNLAQVAATFENDGVHQHLPTEITITRRLDRDGRSDYVINGTSCRLRDVQELFWDTGLGKGSYAVIGQGEVERIVDAGGDDLRRYIEEVAGITRFRVVLKESGDRVARTRDRYRRLADVLAVRREYVLPLKEQAKRARLHRIIGARETRLRQSVLVADYHNALKVLRDCDKIQANLRDRLSGMDQEISQCREHARSQALQAEALTRREELFESGLRTLQRDAGRAESQRALLKERLRTADTEMARALKGLDEVGHARASLDEDRSETLSARVEERENLQAEVQSLQQEAEGRFGRIARDEVILRRAIRREEWLRGAIRQTDAAIVDCEKRLRESLKRSAEVSRQLEELRGGETRNKKAEDASRESTSDADPQEIEGELAAERSRLRRMQEKQRSLQDAYAAAKESAAATSSRITALSEIVGTMPQIPADGAQAAEVTPDEPFLAHLDIPRDLRGAVAAAAGYWSFAHTLASDALTRDHLSPGTLFLIRDLPGRSGAQVKLLTWRQERAGWDDWLLERGFGERVIGWLDLRVGVHEGDEEIRALKDDMLSPYLVIEDRDTMFALLQAMWAAPGLPTPRPPELVTPDGYRASPRGRIGADPVHNETMDPVAVAQEIRTLKEKRIGTLKEIRELETLLGRVREEAEARGNRVSKLDAALTVARQRQDEAERRLHDQRREHHRRTRVLQELESSLEDASQETKRLQEDKAELDVRRRGWIRALGALALFRSGKERAVAGAAGAKEEFDKEIDARRTRIMELADEIARLQASEAHRASEGERLDERESTLRKELAKWDRRRKALLEQSDRYEVRVGGYDAAVKRATEGYKSVRTARREANTAAEHARIRAAELEAEKSKITGKLSSNDARRRRAREDLSRVRLTAEREHGLDQEDLQNAPVVRGIARARREISSLEGRRRSLEPVNPMAIGEYRREVSNLGILEERVRDLRETIEGLEYLCAQLATHVENRFLATLREVSTAFSETFTDLFDGGQGHIRLDHDGKSAYPNLEIRVQPPGKRLTRMSLLSGGERALTGIVFLFALLRVRPAPVCLLDEIDAALDDRNTDRLARYLRDAGGDVQNILITHQKRTMETADALHGVTMSEPGISELVSVRLESVGEFRAAAGPDDDN